MLGKIASLEELRDLTYKVISSDEWFDYYSLCHNFGKIVYLQYENTNKYENKITNSIVFIRFQEMQKLMILLHEVLCLGAYTTFLRELRYILESVLQAHYIEKNYSDISYKGKVSILMEREKLNRNIGRPLINDLGLRDDLRSKILCLYEELSNYVHPTHKELLEVLGDIKRFGRRWVPFYFDEEILRLCVKFLVRILDVVFYFFFNTYQEKLADFAKSKDKLEKRHFKLCVKLLEEQK